MSDIGSWGFKGLQRRYLELPATDTGEDEETAPTQRARIRYNRGAGTLEQSIDGGSWTELGSPAAVSQEDWYIDPVSGNDSRKGDTVEAAIQTHEELRRRIGDTPIEIDLVVHLLEDFGDDNPIFCDFTFGTAGSIRYVGEKTLTEVYSGAFTATSGFDRLNNAPIIVTDAGLPVGWAASDLLNTQIIGTRRIRLTSGLNAGAVAYAVAEDSGDPKAALTTPFGFKQETSIPLDPFYRVINANLGNFPFGPATDLANYGQPEVGDSYVVESGFVQVSVFTVQPTMPGFFLGFIPSKTYVLANDIDFAMQPGGIGESIVTQAPNNSSAPPVFISGCGVGSIAHMLGFVQLDFCRLGTAQQTINARGGSLEIAACLVVGFTLIDPGANLALWVDSIQAFEPVEVRGKLEVRNAGFFAFGANPFSNPSAVYIRPGGTVQTDSFFGNAPQAALYGESTVVGTTGVRFDPGGQLVYLAVGADAAASVTVAGAASDYDLVGVGGSWAATVDDTNTAKLAGLSAL